MSRFLLADIGGTYARFALANERFIGATWSTEVGSRASAIEAIRDFLTLDHGDEPIDGALLAAAGPVEGGALQAHQRSLAARRGGDRPRPIASLGADRQ